jgi:hypothetical protein
MDNLHGWDSRYSALLTAVFYSYFTVTVITGDMIGGLNGICDRSPSTSCSVCRPGGQRHHGFGLAAAEMDVFGVTGNQYHGSNGG